MIRTLCMAFFALAVLATTPAAAQPVLGDTGVIDLQLYDSIVQLGGRGVYMGFTAVPTSGPVDMVRLLVYLPPMPADSLCVELISRDGVFGRRYRYPHRPEEVGWRILPLPARDAGALRQQRPEDLAPLVHLNRKCSGRRGTSVPAGWGSANPNHRLRLLLNPERVDRVFIMWRGDRRQMPCERVEHAVRTAFGYTCDLQAPAAPGARELRIIQMDGITSLDPIIVPVWVPDGV